jgi:hypothetical protein
MKKALALMGAALVVSTALLAPAAQAADGLKGTRTGFLYGPQGKGKTQYSLTITKVVNGAAIGHEQWRVCSAGKDRCKDQNLKGKGWTGPGKVVLTSQGDGNYIGHGRYGTFIAQLKADGGMLISYIVGNSQDARKGACIAEGECPPDNGQHSGNIED